MHEQPLFGLNLVKRKISAKWRAAASHRTLYWSNTHTEMRSPGLEGSPTVRATCETLRLRNNRLSTACQWPISRKFRRAAIDIHSPRGKANNRMVGHQSAAIRQQFDYLTKRILDRQSAASRRAPRHVVKRGNASGARHPRRHASSWTQLKVINLNLPTTWR
jgi:hypothetical protein